MRHSLEREHEMTGKPRRTLKARLFFGIANTALYRNGRGTNASNQIRPDRQYSPLDGAVSHSDPAFSNASRRNFARSRRSSSTFRFAVPVPS